MESAQPLEGVLAEREARLKSYINHVGRAVEQQIQIHYDPPLVDLNQKLDSIIALMPPWVVVVLNILQNSEGNGLEQLGKTSEQVYVSAQANDD